MHQLRKAQDQAKDVEIVTGSSPSSGKSNDQFDYPAALRVVYQLPCTKPALARKLGINSKVLDGIKSDNQEQDLQSMVVFYRASTDNNITTEDLARALHETGFGSIASNCLNL